MLYRGHQEKVYTTLKFSFYVYVFLKFFQKIFDDNWTKKTREDLKIFWKMKMKKSCKIKIWGIRDMYIENTPHTLPFNSFKDNFAEAIASTAHRVYDEEEGEGEEEEEK